MLRTKGDYILVQKTCSRQGYPPVIEGIFKLVHIKVGEMCSFKHSTKAIV